VIYQAVSRSLSNGLKSGPSAQASRNLWSLMSNTRIPLEEQIAALAAIKYDDVVAFSKTILRRVRVKGFFYGQIGGDHVMLLWNHLKKALRGSAEESEALEGSALNEDEEFVSKFRVLPTDQGPFTVEVQGDARGNSTELMIDGGHLDCADRIGLEMLYKEVRQNFFNELRTKQQTGYVAQTSVMEAARRTVALFVVVSSWAGPGDLLGRYETFVQNTLQGLRDGTVLAEANFKTIQSSLLAEFSKPIANIAEMASTLKTVVKDYDGDFEAFMKRAQIIKGMTIERITSAAEKMFGPSNKRRLAVLYSPRGVSPGTPPAQYRPFNSSIGLFEKKPAYKCSVCENENCQPGAELAVNQTNTKNETNSTELPEIAATKPALQDAQSVWEALAYDEDDDEEELNDLN